MNGEIRRVTTGGEVWQPTRARDVFDDTQLLILPGLQPGKAAPASNPLNGFP